MLFQLQILSKSWEHSRQLAQVQFCPSVLDTSLICDLQTSHLFSIVGGVRISLILTAFVSSVTVVHLFTKLMLAF